MWAEIHEFESQCAQWDIRYLTSFGVFFHCASDATGHTVVKKQISLLPSWGKILSE